MAKDDYNVIKFKILVYLYGILKRRVFYRHLRTYAWRKLNKKHYYINSDGGHKFINSDISNVKITARGINHLEENKLMNKIKENALSSLGLLGEFVKKVLL